MAEIAQWIAELAAADRKTREAAAAALYRMGCALGDAATRAWRADPALAALLIGPPTVGIAVRPENFEKIRAACGDPRLAEVPPDQDAREFEVGPGNVRLDILTTRETGQVRGSGAIARFLEKFGEGIQQVEYPTGDVDRAAALIQERFALKPVYPQTRGGADGTRVNFFLVSTPEGRKVLVELVEPAGPATT